LIAFFVIFANSSITFILVCKIKSQRNTSFLKQSDMQKNQRSCDW